MSVTALIPAPRVLPTMQDSGMVKRIVKVCDDESIADFPSESCEDVGGVSVGRKLKKRSLNDVWHGTME